MENKREQRHSEKAKLVAGISACALMVLLGVLIVLGITNRTKEPEMLFPDGVAGDFGDAAPSLAPKLSELSGGKYIFDGRLALVAKHDLPAFSSADDLPDNLLISFAVWSALTDEKSAKSAMTRDDGTILVPTAAVEKSLADSFKLTRAVPHQSVSVYCDFNYSEAEKGYVVSVTGVDTKYIPRVKGVSALTNGTTAVTLDYIDLFANGDAELTDKTAASKTVKLILSGADKNIKVHSLEEIKAK